jgi:hypothetical protein
MRKLVDFGITVDDANKLCVLGLLTHAMNIFLYRNTPMEDLVAAFSNVKVRIWRDRLGSENERNRSFVVKVFQSNRPAKDIVVKDRELDLLTRGRMTWGGRFGSSPEEWFWDIYDSPEADDRPDPADAYLTLNMHSILSRLLERAMDITAVAEPDEHGGGT